MNRGSDELTAVLLSVKDFGADGLPNEEPEIRRLLDEHLKLLTNKSGRPLSCHDVGSTILPVSLWNRSANDSGKQLFAKYERVFERVKARDKRNRKGTYFQRLTSYAPLKVGDKSINQLAHIIKTYNKGNHRRSALQAAVFDPRFDHNDAPMIGFPCLQQVAFAPTDDGLTVTGFYPVQYIFERGYGNYLGLCWLGLFIATQLQMPLVEMNCFVNVAQLGNQRKADLRRLADELARICKS
jgi:hypothetical protein